MDTKIKVSVTYDETGMITHWAVPVRVEPTRPAPRAVDWVEIGLAFLILGMWGVVVAGLAFTL